MNYKIRKMDFNDLEEVLEIMTETGFVVGIDTMNTMIQIDSEGMLVAEDVDKKSIIGMCCGVNINDKLSQIGMYSVRKQYQGLGIGKAIWDRIIKHCENRSISLFSVQTMAEKYEKIGFNLRFEATAQIWTGEPDISSFVNSIDGISIREITDQYLDMICEYDMSICGIERSTFLKIFLKERETVAVVALEKCNNSIEKIVGFGVIKKSNLKYALLQPIYANSYNIAELIARNCCENFRQSMNGLLISVALWDNNCRAKHLISKLGLEYSSAEPMLYTKQLTTCDTSRIYSLLTTTFYPT